MESCFPNAKVFHLTATGSDHFPILTDMDFMLHKKVSKPFKFEPMWLRHGDFKEHDRRYWSHLNSQNDNLHTCLQNPGSALKDWNSNTFGDVKRKLKSLKAELEYLHRQPRTVNIAAKEDCLSQEIDEWLLREEILWKQCARTEWLKDGDCNTKYFHRRASARKSKNKISSLTDVDGAIYTEPVDLNRIIHNYFQGIFTS